MGIEYVKSCNRPRLDWARPSPCRLPLPRYERRYRGSSKKYIGNRNQNSSPRIKGRNLSPVCNWH